MFRSRRQIRFADVDPAGIVFYPRYFEMINATVEDWFEHIGYGFGDMIRRDGYGVPLATIEVDFKRPSEMDDWLDFTLAVKEVGGSSIRVEITALCGEEIRLVARPVLVFVKTAETRPVRIPDALRSKIENYQRGQA